MCKIYKRGILFPETTGVAKNATKHLRIKIPSINEYMDEYIDDPYNKQWRQCFAFQRSSRVAPYDSANYTK